MPVGCRRTQGLVGTRVEWGSCLTAEVTQHCAPLTRPPPAPVTPPPQDPKDRDRVDRECRVMRNLSNHVSIIKMYEVAETPEFVYILMEHCTKG